MAAVERVAIKNRWNGMSIYCRSYLCEKCWNFISCHRIQELFDNLLGPCVAFLLLFESENNLRLAEMEIRLLLFVDQFITEFHTEPTLFLTLDSFLDFLVSIGAAPASMQTPYFVFTRSVFLNSISSSLLPRPTAQRFTETH